MQSINAHIKVNNQLTSISTEKTPSSQTATIKVFNDRGHTPPKSLSVIKAKVESLATTEQRLQEAKDSKVRDRLMSLLKLAGSVLLAGICVLGTLAASALPPAAGVGIFFATFIAFTAFCKYCESTTQKMHKKDTGIDMESSGMLYPLFPIANVVWAFSRCSRIEKLANAERESLEADIEEAGKYIETSYESLSQALDTDISQHESSLRGFMRLKIKPPKGERELSEMIGELKLARAELESYRNFFLELKGT